MLKEKLVDYLKEFNLTDEEITYFELFDVLNVEKIGSLIKGYLLRPGRGRARDLCRQDQAF